MKKLVTIINKITNWIRDYFYLAKGHFLMFHKLPRHYLDHILENKPPIILIPGLHLKWQFLKNIADQISLKGHPIYTLEYLGYNTKAIHHSAKLIRELINEKNLQNVIILAHSKGGLIAKHLLAFDNEDGRVAKVIAIATPFSGSRLAEFIPGKAIKELHPESEMIKKLHSKNGVNHKIISIFGEYDNYVWPTENCRLEGAKNIQVNIHGHHKILFDKHVCDIVLNEIGKV